jgi:hypothetical protein
MTGAGAETTAFLLRDPLPIETAVTAEAGAASRTARFALGRAAGGHPALSRAARARKRFIKGVGRNFAAPVGPRCAPRSKKESSRRRSSPSATLMVSPAASRSGPLPKRSACEARDSFAVDERVLSRWEVRAVVTDVDDPLKIGRVRARPVCSAPVEVGRCRACPGGGKDRGMLFVPEVGDSMVRFAGGEPSRSIWVGVFWGARAAKRFGRCDRGSEQRGHVRRPKARRSRPRLVTVSSSTTRVVIVPLTARQGRGANHQIRRGDHQSEGGSVPRARVRPSCSTTSCSSSTPPTRRFGSSGPPAQPRIVTPLRNRSRVTMPLVLASLKSSPEPMARPRRRQLPASASESGDKPAAAVAGWFSSAGSFLQHGNGAKASSRRPPGLRSPPGVRRSRQHVSRWGRLIVGQLFGPALPHAHRAAGQARCSATSPHEHRISDRRSNASCLVSRKSTIVARFFAAPVADDGRTLPPVSVPLRRSLV